ncbi:MAG: lysylphosphatidylglycerol synthase domain-containing protein [bacterium]
MRSKWEKIIGLPVAAVILFFIIRNLVGGLQDIGRYEVSVDGWRVALAFGVFAIVFPAYAGLWQYLLGRFGYRVGFLKSMRIWFLSQAGRYIPGKVWFALGRIYLCEREGVPPATASVALGIEILLVLGSSLIIFAIGAVAGAGGLRYPYWLALLLLPAVFIGIHPRLIKAILRKLGRDLSGFRLTYGNALLLLACYAGCWCVYGLGFFLIATSVKLGPASPLAAPAGTFSLIRQLSGINAVSWSAGLLSVVTPAGLGVREGVSSMLLGPLFVKPYPSLIPLVARVWVTIAEFATIGILAFARSGE